MVYSHFLNKWPNDIAYNKMANRIKNTVHIEKKNINRDLTVRITKPDHPVAEQKRMGLINEIHTRDFDGIHGLLGVIQEKITDFSRLKREVTEGLAKLSQGLLQNRDLQVGPFQIPVIGGKKHKLVFVTNDPVQARQLKDLAEIGNNRAGAEGEHLSMSTASTDSTTQAVSFSNLTALPPPPPPHN